MEIIDKVKSYFSKKKEPESSPFLASGVNVGFTYDKPKIESSLKNWSGICINRISTNVANTRFYFDKDGKEVTTAFSHFLEKVNNSYRFYDLIFLTCLWLKVHGNAFIWFPKGLSQIWVLPSPNLLFRVGIDGLSGFQLMTDTGIINIPEEEICHIKSMSLSVNNNLDAYYIGQPYELNAVIDAIFSDEEKQEYITRFLQRDGSPPFVISSEKPMNDKTAEDFRIRINKVLPNGYKIAAILDDKKQIFSLDSSTQLISGGVDEQITKIICANYGIPLSFLTGEYQNRATAQIVYETVFKNAIEPLCNLISSYLTGYFHSLGLDPSIKLAYDNPDFYDEQLYNTQVEFAYMNGIIDEIEYRDMLGFPDMPERLINAERTQQITEGTNSGTIIDNAGNQNSGNTENTQ